MHPREDVARKRESLHPLLQEWTMRAARRISSTKRKIDDGGEDPQVRYERIARIIQEEFEIGSEW